MIKGEVLVAKRFQIGLFGVLKEARRRIIASAPQASVAISAPENLPRGSFVTADIATPPLGRFAMTRHSGSKM